MHTKHQRFLIGTIISLVVILIVVAAFLAARVLFRPHVDLRIGDGVFNAYLARTYEEHERGLSGVESISPSDALLFVYDDAQVRSMWMKDMKMPIDIVWLDDQKKVLHTVENLSPNTYPKSFAANKPARYVVELAAGTIKARSITVGKTASFDLDRIQGVTW